MMQGQSGRSTWLEFQLHDLAAVLGPEGHRALLYCGACEADISYGEAAAGPIENWPYCPVHHQKPLMICSTSLHLPSARLRINEQAASGEIPLETWAAMQYSARPHATE